MSLAMIAETAEIPKMFFHCTSSDTPCSKFSVLLLHSSDAVVTGFLRDQFQSSGNTLF